MKTNKSKQQDKKVIKTKHAVLIFIPILLFLLSAVSVTITQDSQIVAAIYLQLCGWVFVLFIAYLVLKFLGLLVKGIIKDWNKPV